MGFLRQPRAVAAAVLVVVALSVVVWRFGYVPARVAVLYTLADQEYAAGNVDQALVHLGRLHRLDPGMFEANMLLGWSHWRLGRPVDAEASFARAHQADSTSVDAMVALGMVRLTIQDVDGALPVLREAARARPAELDVQMMLAGAYRGSGQNLLAAQLYQEMLARDPHAYEAEQALLEIFGYPRLDGEVPRVLPEHPRPDELQLSFRTEGDYLQVYDGGRWRTAYLTGVNLGPGRPGEFAVSSSLEFETYREWFQQIAEMASNTVRSYTILPPAFYQALAAHNADAAEPLWLIQEVWLQDDATDLYDPATKERFELELTNTIDVLHGQADIACRRGHYCGVYTADVSEWVIGIGVGREVEPRMVRITNRLNPQHTTWRGEYVSLDEGTPSEVWFAEMCDRAARYELVKYNAQRPLTVVNWPPLDPMHHPTEATYEEEIRIRKQLGELVQDSVPEDMNDVDAVTIDVTRFRAEPAFQAGLFALYHVYQHWPDFLFLGPSYAEASDSEGPNRYLGYLLELKEAHRDFPLLIGEYGLATSLQPAHLHPEGWHNGGLTYDEQSDLLVRFSRNIRDTRMAGGIVFAWLDEWWKQVHDEFTAPMEPRGNDPLWLNRLDPEEHFGVVGFQPFAKTPLLRGEEADWEGVRRLYPAQEDDDGAPGGAPGTLRAVHATSDYGYLHLRLDLRTGPGLSWEDTRIWIALNTLPGQAGSTLIPEAEIELASGANFLVQLDGLARGRLLVASNYNPWEEWPVPGRPDQIRILRKAGLSLALAPVPFEEIVIEPNQPRWGRDGREFPNIHYSRSHLPYGTADPERQGYSSHATWHVDQAKGMVELRLPWSLLLVMDPTRHQAFVGTDDQRMPQAGPMTGISVAAFVLGGARGEEGAPVTLTGSFPDARIGFRGVRQGAVTGEVAVYDWEPWTRMRFRPYFKPSYYALQRLWAAWPRYMD